jgi:aspartyl-tRNA(Asn)/glutamyl-tRNA(Gln) amidotransferase subunit C
VSWGGVKSAKILYNHGMTQITREDVQHLAQLSSLLLDETEIDSLRTDIEGILKYVEQLSELDTDGVEPSYQVTGLENVWRDDTIIDAGIGREDLLALSPDQKNNQMKVPKVLSW